MHLLFQLTAWFIALSWLTRSLAALRGMPTIPNLLLPQYDQTPPNLPSIAVIVPARNEQADILTCLRSLLSQDYPNLRILAVNDRSTDQTGELMNSLAGGRLQALHITDLPSGWLGKTHAMAHAASHAIAHHSPDYLLFTDADVTFRPDAIRRALANAVATRADHFVLVPTTLIHRWDEAAILSFFQIFGVWGARPWRVANPRALRDAIGIGAFNLIRTEAYQRTGGFEALRMEIVEDLGLARRVKMFGLRQRIAFGRNMVTLHWASGSRGLINIMTKNIFAAFRFHPSLALFACGWLFTFNVAPFLALFFWPFTLPAAVTLASMALTYTLFSRPSGLSPWNTLLAPFAAAAFIYALLRSMFFTLKQGGVIWRGTFYPLAELRKNAAPLFPRRIT